MTKNKEPTLKILRFENNYLGQRRMPVTKLKGKRKYGLQVRHKVFIKTGRGTP